MSIRSELNEIWKYIDNFPDYMISNIGRIKSFKKSNIGDILNLHNNGNGHLFIFLYKNGIKHRKYIHILVYENFYEILKSDEVIHHKDENKNNNNLDNLLKMTISEHRSYHTKDKNNPMFRKNHSLETRNRMSKIKKDKYLGEIHPKSKLKNKDVMEIKKSLDNTQLKLKDIATKFKISISTVSSIKNGRTWSHVKIKENL